MSSNGNSGCTIVAGAIATLASLVTIIIFVSGRESLPAFLPPNRNQPENRVVEPLPSTDTSVATIVVFLRPACGKTINLEAETPVELRYGVWAANGEGILSQNLKNIHAGLAIDGQHIQGKQVSPRASIEPEGICENDYDNSYWSFYVGHINSLASGSHKAEVTFTFSEPVNDGYGEVYKDSFSQQFTLIAR